MDRQQREKTRPEQRVPVVQRQDQRTAALTERITSYGYIVKTSATTVLLASIKMAFRLYVPGDRSVFADKSQCNHDVLQALPFY